MATIVDATRLPESRTFPADAALDDAGVRIGTVSRGGVVIDAGGVTIGVAWPDGGIYDYTGRRIGHTPGLRINVAAPRIGCSWWWSPP